MDRIDAVLGQLLVLVVVVLAAKWLLGYLKRKRAAKPDQTVTTTDKVIDAVAHTLEPDKGEIGSAVQRWLIPTVIGTLAVLFLLALLIGMINAVMGTY